MRNSIQVQFYFSANSDILVVIDRQIHMIPFIIASFILANMPLSAQEATTEADLLFHAALYEKAIPLYEKQLLASNNLDIHAREQLAQSYFNSENYLATIYLLQPISTRTSLENYFLGRAYAKLKQFDETIKILSSMTLNGDFPDQHEMNFELALALFENKQSEQARKLFLTLFQGNSNHYKILGAFYLARIAMQEGKYEESKEILNQSESWISPDDLLKYEFDYLKGELFFHQGDYEKAIKWFEKALPNTNPEKAEWHNETLFLLGKAYLKLIETTELSQEKLTNLFNDANLIFSRLMTYKPDEQSALAFGKFQILKGHRLLDDHALQQADAFLARHDLIVSNDAQAQALLLRAEAAKTYTTRDILYRHLTQEVHKQSPIHAKGWYLRGINDFEEGQRLLNETGLDEAQPLFEKAIRSLMQAYLLLKNTEGAYAGLALKYQALAFYHQGTQEKIQQAQALLETLLNDQALFKQMPEQDEIYYQYALVMCHLTDKELLPSLTAKIESSLQSVIHLPYGKYTDPALILLGKFYYQQGHFQKALESFSALIIKNSTSAQMDEALFWCARCSDQLNHSVESKTYRKELFENYPHSPFSPEAYFTYYTYADYVQGNRSAVKHLTAMTDRYPLSPFTIQAWYLIGLDNKRDRKTLEGRWLRKKNLTAAIDAFQEAESLFDLLYAQQLVPSEELNTLITLRYRASLEKALGNLTIADESQGTKRQIYLEYAEEVLQQLANDLTSKQNPLYPQLSTIKSYPLLQEECLYLLAQAYLKDNKDQLAENILEQMLEKYNSAKITRGYYLSRTWFEKAMIEMYRHNYLEALSALSQAEDTSKGRVLSVDQKLNLWICQSTCYQALGKIDEAILTLSKVINDDSISGLRIKAMYLRALAYEAQERKELARRQLESTSKKGGEWAIKAKEKLVKDYVY